MWRINNYLILGERKFDKYAGEDRQRFNKFDKKKEQETLNNQEEEDFDKLMGEIKEEDAKIFEKQSNSENENKHNIKLPKKSFKDHKTEKAFETANKNKNDDITRIDDAEKFINENKPKKRLRFGEEKKSEELRQNIEATKDEALKPEENLNIEEDSKQTESLDNEINPESTEKNGVIYEYRENK